MKKSPKLARFSMPVDTPRPALWVPTDTKIEPLPLKQEPGNPTTASSLEIGERFEIIGLEKQFRDLYVTTVTSCSVSVKGSVLKDDGWTQLGSSHSIACSTRVRPL